MAGANVIGVEVRSVKTVVEAETEVEAERIEMGDA